MSEKEQHNNEPAKKSISANDKKSYSKIKSLSSNYKNKSKKVPLKKSKQKKYLPNIKMNIESDINQFIDAIDLISEMGSLSSSTLSSKIFSLNMFVITLFIILI
jgi:hypothetical protein